MADRLVELQRELLVVQHDGPPTLGDLGPSSPVNLEADVMGKTIVHWLRHYAPRRDQ